MDLILDALDGYILTPYVYPSSWPEDNILRQFVSLYIILLCGAGFTYLGMATFSYFFLFDHRLKKHPLFLKNQVWLEITYACSSIPFMILLTLPLMILEIRGYSKLYIEVDNFQDWVFLGFSTITFLMFTDCFIYWIHRALHSRVLYKYIHKGHHKWKIPTPFASHAFNPVDGWLQSLPYHFYPFLFPLHKVLYLVLFVFVNIWTVSIHDANYRVPAFLRPFINGSAHHTDHHLYYLYNYGQFFTLWDRIGGSFRFPSAFEGSTLLCALNDQKTLSEQLIANEEKLKEL